MQNSTNPVDDNKKLNQEMVMSHNARRRLLLEAQVRQELMIERAKGQHPSIFHSFSSSFRLPSFGYLNRSTSGMGVTDQLRPEINFEDRLGLLSRHKTWGSNSCTIPEVQLEHGRQLQQAKYVEKLAVASSPRSQHDIELMAEACTKPEAYPVRSSVAALGRKAENQQVADGIKTLSSSSRKRTRKEWNCTLCGITVTSEQQLATHLTGKKHKAKAALLIKGKAQEKNDGNLLVDMNQKQDKAEPASFSNGKTEEENNDPHKAKESSQSNSEVKESKNSNQFVMEEKNEYKKFWCQMCMVGTATEALIEKHRTGKKHMNLLKEHRGSVIVISTLPEDCQELETAAASDGKNELKKKAENINEVEEDKAQELE